MKYSYSILFFFAAAIMLARCNCMRTCSNPVMALNFVGFDSADLKTVVVKEFLNNGSFDHLLQTRNYSISNPGGDVYPIVNNKTFEGVGLNDYIVEVPSLSRSWTVKNIHMIYYKSENTSCTGGMDYTVNDSVHHVLANLGQANAPGNIDIVK